MFNVFAHFIKIFIVPISFIANNSHEKFSQMRKSNDKVTTSASAFKIGFYWIDPTSTYSGVK